MGGGSLTSISVYVCVCVCKNKNRVFLIVHPHRMMSLFPFPVLTNFSILHLSSVWLPHLPISWNYLYSSLMTSKCQIHALQCHLKLLPLLLSWNFLLCWVHDTTLSGSPLCSHYFTEASARSSCLTTALIILKRTYSWGFGPCLATPAFKNPYHQSWRLMWILCFKAS